MARPKQKTPTYLLHRPSGKAQMAWTDSAGKRHCRTLPGLWNSKESREAERRLIAELDTSPHTAAVGTHPANLLLSEMMLAFVTWAKNEYRTDPNAEPSAELRHYKTAIRMIRDLYPDLEAAKFGPVALKSVRRTMENRGWCRTTVNRQTNRIVRIFRWGVQEELIDQAVHQALATVIGLRKGKSIAKETPPVQAVQESVVDATLPFLNRHVAGLVELQRLTGCRPGEAMRITRGQIDMGGDVWEYTPQKHKMSHKNQHRIIPIGPKAQAVLKAFFTQDINDCLFSPIRAVEEVRAVRAANRKTPRYPSSVKRDAAKRKTKPKRAPADRYNRLSYLTAITRACDKAFPAPVPLGQLEGESVAKWKARLSPEQKEQLAEWQRDHRWHPYQLRHLAATKVRKLGGLEAAQELLGHKLQSTTEGYAKPGLSLAIGVAKRIG